MQKQERAMLKNIVQVCFAVAVLVAINPQSVSAADPTLVATHGKWSAYYTDESGSKVCYMASEPTKHEGKYKERGAIYALVTNRPAESTKNVFSYIAGYPYKAGSDVTVTIGDQSFSLFTQEDTAWAPDAATDEKIVQAMRKGTNMVVKGVSSRGTQTTDTYSLTGTGAAHDAITKECGSR
jgi:invasion protein IalB